MVKLYKKYYSLINLIRRWTSNIFCQGYLNGRKFGLQTPPCSRGSLPKVYFCCMFGPQWGLPNLPTPKAWLVPISHQQPLPKGSAGHVPGNSKHLAGTDCVPGTPWRLLHLLMHLISIITPWAKSHHYPHFSDNDPGMQRGLSNLHSHRQSLEEPRQQFLVPGLCFPAPSWVETSTLF